MVQSVSDQVQSFGKDKIVEVFERICGQMPEQEQQFVSFFMCTNFNDIEEWKMILCSSKI